MIFKFNFSTTKNLTLYSLDKHIAGVGARYLLELEGLKYLNVREASLRCQVLFLVSVGVRVLSATNKPLFQRPLYLWSEKALGWTLSDCERLSVEKYTLMNSSHEILF